MSGYIFADEVVNNGRFEKFSLVGNEVLDAEMTAQITRIIEILGVSVLLVEAEGNTDNLVPGILQKQCRYGAVRAATHS